MFIYLKLILIRREEKTENSDVQRQNYQRIYLTRAIINMKEPAKSQETQRMWGLPKSQNY